MLKNWLFVAGLFGVIVTGYLVATAKPQEPIKITGNFFRLTVNLKYKGQPVQISYPVGCKANVSRQIDGDVSVDGTSISPFVFGQKMHDGGALVIDTPDFCSPAWSSDSTKAEYRIPSDYNPTIIQFEDAEKPWFGMAYLEKVAYKSPHSVMEFVSSRVDRIAGEEWLRWRRMNPSANWVTWEKMGLNPNWFKTFDWKPGEKHMPTVCYFGSILKFPAEVSDQIREYWPPNHPYLWGNRKAADKLHFDIIGYRERYFGYPPGKPRPPEVLFDGYPAWEYGRTPISPTTPLYPAVSDVSMNDLLPNGTIDPTKILDGDKLPYGGWKSISVGQVVTGFDVQFREDLRGFAYCNGAHKMSYENYSRAFGAYGRAYKVNGTPIEGEYIPRYAKTTSAFLNDHSRIGFGEILIFGKGGGL